VLVSFEGYGYVRHGGGYGKVQFEGDSERRGEVPSD